MTKHSVGNFNKPDIQKCTNQSEISKPISTLSPSSETITLTKSPITSSLPEPLDSKSTSAAVRSIPKLASHLSHEQESPDVATSKSSSAAIALVQMPVSEVLHDAAINSFQTSEYDSCHQRNSSHQTSAGSLDTAAIMPSSAAVEHFPISDFLLDTSIKPVPSCASYSSYQRDVGLPEVAISNLLSAVVANIPVSEHRHDASLRTSAFDSPHQIDACPPVLLHDASVEYFPGSANDSSVVQTSDLLYDLVSSMSPSRTVASAQNPVSDLSLDGAVSCSASASSRYKLCGSLHDLVNSRRPSPAATHSTSSPSSSLCHAKVNQKNDSKTPRSSSLTSTKSSAHFHAAGSSHDLQAPPVIRVPQGLLASVLCLLSTSHNVRAQPDVHLFRYLRPPWSSNIFHDGHGRIAPAN